MRGWQVRVLYGPQTKKLPAKGVFCYVDRSKCLEALAAGLEAVLPYI